ncbi:hypothetical protein [Streptomyces sp. NPDC055186]
MCAWSHSTSSSRNRTTPSYSSDRACRLIAASPFSSGTYLAASPRALSA